MTFRRDLTAVLTAIRQRSPVVVDVPAEVRRLLLERYLEMSRSNGRLALGTLALVVFGFGREAPLAARLGLWGVLACTVLLREWRYYRMVRALDALEPRSDGFYDLVVLVGSSVWGFVPLVLDSSLSPINLYSTIFAAIMAIGLLAISYAAAIPLAVTTVTVSLVPFCIWAARQPGFEGMWLILGALIAGVSLLQRVSNSHATLLQVLASEAENARLVAELQLYRRALESENASLGLSLRDAHHAASRDSLTSLFNRRYLETFARPLADTVTRLGEDVTLCIIDVDYFKRVNDRHGHPVGDEVLRAVAGLLGNRLRDLDCLARYGGEEFVILLRRCEISRGRRVAESLRTAIAQAEIDTEAGVLAVTVSIGVAQWSAGEMLEDVVLRADRALYEAKKDGRDRVELDAGDRMRLLGHATAGDTFPAPLH